MAVQRWVLRVYDGIKTLNTSHEGLMYKLDRYPYTRLCVKPYHIAPLKGRA